MSDNFNIANKLKELRLKNNLQIKQMAEKLDLPPTTYAGYEKDREPKASTLIKISQVFDISLDELLGLKVKKNITNIEKLIDAVYALTIYGGLSIVRIEDEFTHNIFRARFESATFEEFLIEAYDMINIYNSGSLKKYVFDLWIKDIKEVYANGDDSDAKILNTDDVFRNLKDLDEDFPF